jgi:hypothetical protein
VVSEALANAAKHAADVAGLARSSSSLGQLRLMAATAVARGPGSAVA